MSKAIEFSFNSDEVMSFVAWYFGVPLFVGLMTNSKWAVLTFTLIAILMPVAREAVNQREKRTNHDKEQ